MKQNAMHTYVLPVKKPVLNCRFVLRFAFLFLLISVTQHSFSQSTLLNENFGTGTTFPTGWTTNSATDWTISNVNNSTGYTGASGGSNAYFTPTDTVTKAFTYSNNLSTVGYTNVTVLWGGRYIRLSSTTYTINLTLSWSADSITWNNVSFTNIPQLVTPGSWSLVNSGTRIALPPAAAGIPNLRLRFMATSSSNAANSMNTIYRIDDVTVLACPVNPISYAGAPFCKSLTTAQPVTASNAAGGTYSSTTGLSLNATTGAITPSTSTAGTYTVTYSVAASGSCAAFTTTTPVTITNIPSATISYAGSPYCKTLTAQAVTLSGTTGGVFSSTAGLTINASTGAITPSTSTAGSYTVTYTIAAAGGCSAFSTTASVVIYDIPAVSTTTTETCVGGSTGAITVNATGGGSPYTYSLNAGTYQAAASFTALAAGTYTVNTKTTNGCVISNSVTVIRSPNSTDDQNITATDSWIGHAYDGINFTDYIGRFTETELFNELFGGSTNCFSVTATAGTRSIYTETFSTKFLMNSTKKGLYTVNLGADDGHRLTIDGTLMYNRWSDASYAVKSNVLMKLTGSSNLLYEFYENTGSNQVSYQGLTLLLANNLTTNTSQTICLGNASGLAISGDAFGTLPVGIALSGTGYQWSYSTTPGGTRIDLTGATLATYTPLTTSAPFNTAGTYYLYRTATLTSTNNTGFVTYTAALESNVATITTVPAPTATISYAGSPYCMNAGSTTVTRTGSAGGTYSSTIGLTIDASTGAITLNSSTAGTYTVTYSIAATLLCTAFSTTTSVTVTAPPSATISYVGTPYCNSLTTNQAVTRTGSSGGSFSSTAGLSINSTTGEITPNTSTAGTYTITYTIVAAGGCAAFTTSTSITITALPAATISYPGNPFCKSLTTAQAVTQTGTTGGAYSSTAGLSIDVGIGAIIPSTSTAGSYTVTYTIAAANGCAAVSTTASVIITTAPSATITYAGTPFCKSLTATQPVTLAGTTGGTYSSTAGLSISSSTGDITPSTSTAGTYTVVYTIAASGGCAAFSTTTAVTITAIPSASISYSGSPFCSSITAAQQVVLTGTTGGTYSSSIGLSINTSTGAIVPNTSTPGTYTITYTIAAANGCSAVSTTTPVTITTAPNASITYSGTPYCSSNGTATVSLTGTTGGTFSATTGLSINSANGSIATGSSVAGTYTITYSIAASGGCAAFSTTTPVTITAAPAATISYNGTPFCNTITAAQVVTQSGTTGGTYSVTTGLSLNATTGGVIPNASTAGSYTVTYTITASGGCAAFSTTTPVSITALPAATIAYAGSPYCSDAGTATVSLSGSSGGTYSSTAGLSIGSTGHVNIAASIVDNYTVTYTIPASGGCSAVTATTPFSIKTAGIWTGATSSDFGTGSNWLCGSIPAITTNVIIPAGLSVYPVITGTNKVNNISIASGASLTIKGTFQITGTITNNGKFSATNGTVEFNGSTAQSIPTGLFDSTLVKNLTINNTAGVTLSDTLKLTGILKISNGQFNTSDKLVLKSTAAATAMVGSITSMAATPVNGKVTVERYIPGRRKYRLMTSSVTTSSAATLTTGQEALSIWGTWQNGGNSTIANVGTFITGGSSIDGFDPQTTNASLFTYDDVNRRYVGFTTANGKKTKYTPLKAGVPYYMFVYGDRINTIITSTPNNTVLVAAGTLLTGDQAYTTSSALPLSPVVGRFSFLGNPFASAINWATIPKTNLDNAYWGWDPNLSSTGGYITVMTSGTVTLQAPYTGTTGLNQYIQPGQGFFVKTTAAAPTLTIREQDKMTNFNGNAFRSGSIDSISLLAINLLYPNGSTKALADGVVTAFDNDVSVTSEAGNATKMVNSTENIALLKDTTWLSIYTRPVPHNNDTLRLNLWRLTKPQYTLQIFAQQMARPGRQAYLSDRYLDTLLPLSLTDTNYVDFFVVPGVPASSDTNRFRIVFRSVDIPLPVTFVAVQANAAAKKIQVDWAVANEKDIQQYEVEKATNRLAFIKAGSVSGTGSSITAAYRWTDEKPATGNNYYRIRAVQKDGQFIFSKTVVIKAVPVDFTITVFPNPVTENQLLLRCDELEKGHYSITVVNTQGSRVFYKDVQHIGGPFNQFILFNTTLPKGAYHLTITNNHFQNRQTFLVQ